MTSVTRPRRGTDFSRFPASIPIVIDNGASTFRIGWAGEMGPRATFRNVVQRPRHRGTGETVTIVGDTDPALMKFFDCTRSAVRSPFADDVVYQFEYMEYILDYGFDRLGVNSEVGHPILMTECECNPSFSRARMAELLFETYGVPSIAFGIDNAFSYKYNQKLGNCGEDGLAISCEHGTCHVVPWRFEASGTFSTKSAYRAFLVGSITFEPWKRLWRSWAPGKCKTFVWLAMRNRCWTSDRLQKRGLPHPERCPLCDQEEETVQHILTTCVFARQFWFSILEPLNLAAVVPSRRAKSFADWWRRSWKKIQKHQWKGFNSLLILGAWILWKHRNACVFDGAAPCLQIALHAFKDEFHLWQLAGAKGLAGLNQERGVN